jgi:hypothetical protein
MKAALEALGSKHRSWASSHGSSPQWQPQQLGLWQRYLVELQDYLALGSTAEEEVPDQGRRYPTYIVTVSSEQHRTYG